MADMALEERRRRAAAWLPRQAGCDERAALRGAFFDGNTYEDLAQRMSVPLGTMKSRIRRAMIKLKACLEPK